MYHFFRKKSALFVFQNTWKQVRPIQYRQHGQKYHQYFHIFPQTIYSAGKRSIAAFKDIRTPLRGKRLDKFFCKDKFLNGYTEKWITPLKQINSFRVLRGPFSLAAFSLVWQRWGKVSVLLPVLQVDCLLWRLFLPVSCPNPTQTNRQDLSDW